MPDLLRNSLSKSLRDCQVQLLGALLINNKQWEEDCKLSKWSLEQNWILKYPDDPLPSFQDITDEEVREAVLKRGYKIQNQKSCKRKKMQCPKCDEMIVNVNRHLITVHKLKKDLTKSLTTIRRMEVKRDRKSKYEKKRSTKICP